MIISNMSTEEQIMKKVLEESRETYKMERLSREGQIEGISEEQILKLVLEISKEETGILESEEDKIRIATAASLEETSKNLYTNTCLFDTLAAMLNCDKKTIRYIVENELKVMVKKIGTKIEELTMGEQLSKDVLVRILNKNKLWADGLENGRECIYGDVTGTYMSGGFIRFNYTKYKDSFSGHYEWVKK